MSDKKISQLTASTTPLAGTEVLPIVQSSTTKKVAVSDLTAGRAVAMLSNTMVGATARNDVDRTGGSGYGYRMKGNDQDNVRFRFENTGGQIFELVGGNPGASNDGFCLFDATASAKRLYVGSTGDVTVNTGNLVIGTAGKGIDFSVNSSAAGMISELLNDYEIGTFTGTLTSATPPTTPITSTGYYTKVGDIVNVIITFTNVDNTGAAGAISITGLPFAALAGVESTGVARLSRTTLTNGLAARIFASSTTITIVDFNSNAVSWASAGAGVYSGFQLTYKV